MKLSKATLDVLRNFASINQNVMIHPGQVLSTRTVAKNIYVEATVEDTFPQEFGIYNLNEFLGIVGLFSDPQFDMTANSVTISQGKNRVQYAFAAPEVLDFPDESVKKVKAVAFDAEFELSEEVLKSVLKAGAILGATDLLISGEDGVITCTVIDPKNPSSNTFATEVGTTDQSFKLYIKLESLKMPSGMYTVKLSRKKIAHFSSMTQSYNIYVANEKNSTWA